MGKKKQQEPPKNTQNPRKVPTKSNTESVVPSDLAASSQMHAKSDNAAPPPSHPAVAPAHAPGPPSHPAVAPAHAPGPPSHPAVAPAHAGTHDFPEASYHAGTEYHQHGGCGCQAYGDRVYGDRAYGHHSYGHQAYGHYHCMVPYMQGRTPYGMESHQQWSMERGRGAFQRAPRRPYVRNPSRGPPRDYSHNSARDARDDSRWSAVASEREPGGEYHESYAEVTRSRARGKRWTRESFLNACVLWKSNHEHDFEKFQERLRRRQEFLDDMDEVNLTEEDRKSVIRNLKIHYGVHRVRPME